jgi:ubiquinone/menaquinone biosynthesis C-methylase UbiE
MRNGPPKRRVSRVDYGRVAAEYDRRYRDGEPPELTAFVRGRAEEARGRPLLDVGCGTGRWLTAALDAGARAVGLDPAPAMLDRARQRRRDARLVQGRAEDLPFPSGHFAAVLCVYVVHHLDDGARFVAEAARVLAPGGTLSVLALAPHDGSDRWYVYDYFRGTREADLERYPTTASIAAWMTAAGLADVGTSVAARIKGEAAGSAVLDDPILWRHGTCQLALLSDEAFEEGLDRIRRDAAAPIPTTFVTDLRIFATVGVKTA